MQIQAEQLEILGERALKNFQTRMVAHLREHFPERCAKVDDEKLYLAVDHGMQRARRRGVTREREFCLWLHLMFVFGSQFDQDTRYPWINAVLNDPALSNPIHKVQRLYQRAELQTALETQRE